MKPNIALITVDSLRADHLSCYGYDRQTTPNIDEYARDGHIFTNAFSHACATRPSVPAILTSSHPLMYGGFERVSDERTLVSEVLSDQGYDTAGFHSNPYLGAEYGYGRGFDTFFDSREDPSVTERLRGGVKSRLNTNGRLFNFLQRIYDRAERTTGVNIGTYHVSAEDITDRALDWVRDIEKSDDPAFLWIHYMDPHHPYAPPEEFQQFSSVDRSEGIRLRPSMLDKDVTTTEDELANLVTLYDDEIRYTDSEIGRLLSGLEEYWNDWTAVITADHGEEFKDHGEFSHQNRFYDEVMHVPLVVYDGESTGNHSEVVGQVDIAPTILDWANVPDQPEQFWGYSLVPLLSGRADEYAREGVRGSWVDLGNGDRRFVYRTANWKYIRDEVYEREQLFNLEADPEESSNLIEAEAEQPAVLDEMRQVIDTYVSDIENTDVDIDEVEMDQEVKERLQNLGYTE